LSILFSKNKKFFIVVDPTTNLGLRYRKTLLSIKLNAQVILAGSSGIARFATVLGVKNADCHTPPAVLVRDGSTLSSTGSVALSL
jgi:hypothetical protein